MTGSTSPRTYAQVAASPPTTPKQKATALRSRKSGIYDIHSKRSTTVTTAKITIKQSTSPSPRRPPIPAAPTATAPKARNATPGPTAPRPASSAELHHLWPDMSPNASEYRFDDIDMAAFKQSMAESKRRYGTPTSEDWRNLSVHGTGSVASDDVAAIIGDTVGTDHVDLENFITDGTDRYGETIPGQEAAQEYARAKKRQRTGDSPPSPGPPNQHRYASANIAPERLDRPPRNHPDVMESTICRAPLPSTPSLRRETQRWGPD
ncbi:hypothetical protein C2E23DRAFT_863609 [Lenzites betulinus]|nr:hypothetical protein C2E23DRAFT_863609 [Lenzites betulinus]